MSGKEMHMGQHNESDGNTYGVDGTNSSRKKSPRSRTDCDEDDDAIDSPLPTERARRLDLSASGVAKRSSCAS